MWKWAFKKWISNMKKGVLNLILLFLFLAITENIQAQEPKWVIFDPDYPNDFIDAHSMAVSEGGIITFWERAGNRTEKKQNGEITYAQYTLNEIDCMSKRHRDIRWDMALEDQNTEGGEKARATFLQSTAKLQKKLPTSWEGIEPDRHNYAHYDFVCNGLQPK
jgi:hypothetical protein